MAAKLCEAFLFLFVEGGVDRVYVLLIHLLARQPERLAEALVVDDLALAQEAYDVVDVRIVGEAEDIVVGDARLLLRADSRGLRADADSGGACIHYRLYAL